MQQHPKKRPPDPPDPTSTQARYAEVAVPYHVFNTFTYRLPGALQQVAKPGARIVVPLGPRMVTGYIVAVLDQLNTTSLVESDIKDAEEILDATPIVTPELLQITKWVSEYYLAPWGEVIKAALPPGISPPIERFVSITEKGRQELSDPSASLSPVGRQLLTTLLESNDCETETLTREAGRSKAVRELRELEARELVNVIQRASPGSVRARLRKVVRLISSGNLEKVTEPQRRVIEYLGGQDWVPLQRLLSGADVSASSIKTLQKKGLIEVAEESLRRDPLAGELLPPVEQLALTAAQAEALQNIEAAIKQKIFVSFLLHGVTGSGKTEVYIRAMSLALEAGGSALMLVPEIALTPVFSRRLRAHFGDHVAIFHSSLSRGERFDEWTRVKAGIARVVIGTRSAVFAPVQNLALVVVDEEHEASYRQEDSPQYNARDTAIVRAQTEGAVVVLGSATPSLESFHNAHSGKYRYLELPQRIANRPLAQAELVDMRRVFDKHKKPQVFADELLQAISDTHERGEQSIILINRRGYSSFVLCRSCGETIQCPNCDVTLTYHRSERVIVCHYCNHREAAPTQCPTCEGKYIYYIGEGTEQIQALLQQRFPQLRIARIDRDTTARRRVFEKSLSDFSEGKLDMLVGTQMLAKGHDYPNVTLVGVVSVDVGLALADFRAAERTFQLLTQVAGRAGRGDRPGQVLIQTYHPDHYALKHASRQDYLGFYRDEIRHRQNHSYPPFVSLASMLIHGAELGLVRSDALALRKELDAANSERACRILGPAPAPLARLKKEFRYQVLIKSRSRRTLREVSRLAINAVAKQGVNPRSINLNIDPVSML
ncbi:MAG TPA: primosomal protein N' [Pyrinomonadaceae bacterium]|nr:primosomal protein N' [Pyrinomonadaceae bacterium]